MKRKASLLATLAFLSGFAPLGFSQGRESQPSPVLPPDILGPQLIAWSQVQKPRPVLQTLPPPDKASSNVYELDDQDRAKKDEGKQVRVNGTLDAKGTSAHVLEIELIP